MNLKDYMANLPQYGTPESVAHHRAYHAQFVNEATIACVVSLIGADRLRASTDKSFNDIPLGMWDSLAGFLPVAMSLAAVGDRWNLGSAVCIAKEAARQYLERTA